MVGHVFVVQGDSRADVEVVVVGKLQEGGRGGGRVTGDRETNAVLRVGR